MSKTFNKFSTHQYIYINQKAKKNANCYYSNVELTSTFLLYRGLVHHHHRILNF